jgi:DNA polymerase III subunit beta
MDVTLKVAELRRPWTWIAGNTGRGKEHVTHNDGPGKAWIETRVNRKDARNHVLISADRGGPVRLAAWGRSIRVSAVVPGARVDAPGRALVLPSDLAKILKACRSEEVNLVEIVSGWRAEFGRSTFSFQSPDAVNFPEPAPFEGAGCHVLPASTFARAVRLTAFAADPKSARYALGGVLIEAQDSALDFVATDGRRIAHHRCTSPTVEGTPFRPTTHAPVVPLRAIREAEDLAGMLDVDDPVELAFGPGAFEFRTGLGSIRSPLVDGRFPDWRRHLPPAGPVARLAFPDPQALLRAVELAAVVTAPEHEGIVLDLSAGRLILDCESPHYGRSRVDLAADFAGDPLRLALDHRLLHDALATLEPDEPVTLELSGPDRPIALRAEGWTFGLMTLIAAPVTVTGRVAEVVTIA